MADEKAKIVTDATGPGSGPARSSRTGSQAGTARSRGSRPG